MVQFCFLSRLLWLFAVTLHPLLVATIDNMTAQYLKVKDYLALSFEGLRA